MQGPFLSSRQQMCLSPDAPTSLSQLPTQKLLFVLGKGGVGRSTVSASLASLYAEQQKKVLVVQWSVHDSVSPFFGSLSRMSHAAREVSPGISVMNFNADEAMKEYFVEHLK